MKRSNKELFSILVACMGLMLLMLCLFLLTGQTAPAYADPGERYVATTGEDDTDCTEATDPCLTVQHAVDVADPLDLIKVAAGVYDDVNNHSGLDQVLYISKTVTVQGGYTTTDDFAGPPDPETNQTELDAKGGGRGVYITGEISPTLEGLRITGGEATGLGGAFSGTDAGGGVYIITATATISNCVIYSNTASTDDRGYGGGLWLVESPATLTGNRVLSNTASTVDSGSGGGIFLRMSDATLQGNLVQGNVGSAVGSDGNGGGMYISSGHTMVVGNSFLNNAANEGSFGQGGGVRADLEGGDNSLTLTGNQVLGNIAGTSGEGQGGGIYVGSGPATLVGNTVQGNTASIGAEGNGGGLYLGWPETITLKSNIIISNTAALDAASQGRGGGLHAREGTYFTLTNNLVAGNQANTAGSGLWFGRGMMSGDTRSSGRLLHNTIADNPMAVPGAGIANNGGAQGIFVDDKTTLALTNTIISGHSGTGISVTVGGTATLEATLWFGNGADTGGGGLIYTGTINIYDDPAFVDPTAWDYHLGPGSGAMDEGVDAGVDDDFDGDSRPQASGFDIGADEAVCVTGAAIAGPAAGIVGTTYAFTATFTPANASTPVTYSWTPVPDSGQSTSVAEYAWTSGGPQMITVTVANACGEADGEHSITICQPLSGVDIVGPVTGSTGMTYTFTATLTPSESSLPVTYTWSPAPGQGQGTAQAEYRWTTAGKVTLTLTATNCSGIGTANDDHVIDIALGMHYVYLPVVLRNEP